jgi:TolB-like protein/DNA-binding winged helix-turn-helix (wHTH) protein
VPAQIYEFGELRLDSGRFELLRVGRPLKLERKPMELLLLLVEARGNLVTRSEIAQKLWDSEVFVDTEHGINTAIRKIRLILRDDPESPRFILTVPSMGYRFIAPVTLPEPNRPSEAVHQPETAAVRSNDPKTGRSRRSLWIAGCAAAAVTALMIGATVGPHPWGARIFHRSETPMIASLAVLPLDNLSGDPNQEYFADGMTDELITQLARDSTLRITSRTSVMQYKAAHRPLREIAQALNVDAIVEGSVKRNGNQVHMTLQLIHADTDSHLWADSYDRENDDTTLPDEAARAIAARLQRTVASLPPVRPVNPEAHDDYLRGQYLWMVGRNRESGEFFRKAVEIQPDYAAGWAGLSEYLAEEALSEDRKPPEALAQSEAAARKALELDDSLWHAHLDMGAALLFSHWDFTGALKEIDRAAELDPRNSQVYHLKAKVLCALNRFNEANAAQAQATAANAFEHPGARAEIFACTRQYDAAIQDAVLRLRDFPTAADLLWDLEEAYHWTGQDDESVKMLSRELASEGDAELSKAVRIAFAEGGYRAVLQNALAAYQRRARAQGVSPVILARLNAQLGHGDAAIRLLNHAADEHAPLLVFNINDPAFDSLHNNPRFRAIAQKVGLPYETPTSGSK